MQPQKSKMATATTILVLVFSYAIIRYNIIRGVAWTELPLFISNKALALAAVAFITLSYTLGSLARFWPKTFVPSLSFRKFFGLLGFALAAIHTLVSLLLFTPAYYSKFFLGNGRLNLTGELSMLFGVLAFFIFAIVAISSLPDIAQRFDQKRWLAIQRLGFLALILVFFHVLSMGLEGWLQPSGWPGGLLPISLVAATIIAFGLLFKIMALLFPRQKENKI